MKKIFCTFALVAALLFCGLAINNRSLLPHVQANTDANQNQQEISEPEVTLYQKNCASCHEREVMGAPKPGDPRFQEDIEVLVDNAINGIGNMPARGHAAFLSDDEIRSIIKYMASYKSK